MTDFCDAKIEILLREWDFLKKDVARLDNLVFSIRGWAISLVAAIISYSFVSNNNTVVVYGIVPILMFWFLDALFKSFQRNFIKRINEIENYLASDQFKIDFNSREIKSFVTPNTKKYFSTEIGWQKRLILVLKTAFIRNVFVSYVFMIIALLAVFTINSSFL